MTCHSQVQSYHESLLIRIGEKGRFVALPVTPAFMNVSFLPLGDLLSSIPKRWGEVKSFVVIGRRDIRRLWGEGGK